MIESFEDGTITLEPGWIAEPIEQPTLKAPTLKASRCPSCGASLKPGSSDCRYCGTMFAIPSLMIEADGTSLYSSKNISYEHHEIHGPTRGTGAK